MRVTAWHLFSRGNAELLIHIPSLFRTTGWLSLVSIYTCLWSSQSIELPEDWMANQIPLTLTRDFWNCVFSLIGWLSRKHDSFNLLNVCFSIILITIIVYVQNIFHISYLNFIITSINKTFKWVGGWRGYKTVTIYLYRLMTDVKFRLKWSNAFTYCLALWTSESATILSWSLNEVNYTVELQ